MQQRPNKSTAHRKNNWTAALSKYAICSICLKHTVNTQYYVAAIYYIHMIYVMILSYYNAAGSKCFTVKQGQKYSISWFWENSSKKCHINTLNYFHIALILLLVPHLFLARLGVVKKNFTTHADMSFHFYLRGFPPLFFSCLQSVVHLRLRTEARFSE